ncbi:MAG: HAD family hydrolase, partial [Candidatus Methanospirareceae archaeon]
GGGIKYVIAGGINFFPGTLKLLKDLREMGVSVFVASGDRIEREEMAAYLPDVPPENLFGMMKPEDKRDLVRRLKEKQTVVMVGDDRNDYLAMCEADISVLSLQEEADRPGAILEIADFRIKKIGEVKGIIEEMRECVSKQGEGGAREGGAREGGARGGEVKW